MLSEIEITKKTYEEWVETYIKNTQSIVQWEIKEWIDSVLLLIKPNQKILEVWSWSWRDAAYIESNDILYKDQIELRHLYTIYKSDIHVFT